MLYKYEGNFTCAIWAVATAIGFHDLLYSTRLVTVVGLETIPHHAKKKQYETEASHFMENALWGDDTTWAKFIYTYLVSWHTSPATLTHLPLVQHLCVSEMGQHLFRQWLVGCSAPSHYLNQRWVIVNWNLMINRQWNSNQNTFFFIHKNTFEMSSAKWSPVFFPGRDELIACCLWPLLLTWFNFNPSMDK